MVRLKTKDITVDELNNTLATCPNNKAAGIPGISYKMIKHYMKDNMLMNASNRVCHVIPDFQT